MVCISDQMNPAKGLIWDVTRKTNLMVISFHIWCTILITWKSGLIQREEDSLSSFYLKIHPIRYWSASNHGLTYSGNSQESPPSINKIWWTNGRQIMTMWWLSSDDWAVMTERRSQESTDFRLLVKINDIFTHLDRLGSWQIDASLNSSAWRCVRESVTIYRQDGDRVAERE